MSAHSLIVRRSLGKGNFVVTSNCHADVPVGTEFRGLSSERKRYENQVLILEATGPNVNISLTIVAVEFWRKPWTCVPYGHHAGVQFEGDIAVLEAYLAERPEPWGVFLNSENSVGRQILGAAE